MLEFHSLNGQTIGERRKNLFSLLNNTHKTLKNSQSDIDFNIVIPETPLEQGFKIDALIHFQKINDLVEVLKTENSVLINKVLKVSPWLLQKAFADINGDQLVNSIFPNISFNARIKVCCIYVLHLY